MLYVFSCSPTSGAPGKLLPTAGLYAVTPAVDSIMAKKLVLPSVVPKLAFNKFRLSAISSRPSPASELKVAEFLCPKLKATASLRSAKVLQSVDVALSPVSHRKRTPTATIPTGCVGPIPDPATPMVSENLKIAAAEGGLYGKTTAQIISRNSASVCLHGFINGRRRCSCGKEKFFREMRSDTINGVLAAVVVSAITKHIHLLAICAIGGKVMVQSKPPF
jgi:hypothetical protein